MLQSPRQWAQFGFSGILRQPFGEVAMKRMELASGFALALMLAGTAEGQQAPPPFDPVQTEINAEDAAGEAMVHAGEQYLVAGVVGPDSQSCRLLTSAIRHFSNVASITKKQRPLADRDRKLRERASRAA
jgi:hypothetical protein